MIARRNSVCPYLDRHCVAETILVGPASNPVSLGFTADSNGGAQANATLGSLGASVTATASVTPADYIVDGMQYPSPFSAGATAFAEAQWMDTITVQSATLSYGTPVTFLAGLTLDDIPSLSGSGVLQVPGSGLTAGLVVAGMSLSLQDSVANPLFDQTATKVLNLSVGETFFVSASLTAAVGIEANPSITASIDGIDTSNFFLTPLTPGATYSTASGMTYNPVSAVPEPSSILLLVPVLLALVVVASRSSARCGLPDADAIPNA